VADNNRDALAILRRKQVEARTGLSRSTIYDAIKAGRFPAPVRIGARAVGWLSGEVDAWLSAAIARSRKSA
jgi:prophage regulatory protein